MTTQYYDDTAVKWMVYPAMIFMALGMFIGVFMAFNVFVFPDYFQGEYVHFGKIRPMHVSGVLFLWLLSGSVGLIYYIVPRLCGVPLWSQRLAKITAVLWWITLIVGVFSFPFGTNFGWEYEELPVRVGSFIYPKIYFTIAWVLFATNIFMTIGNRRHKKMYVSLWYTMGTLIWTGLVWIAGNFVIELVPGGVSRVNTNFFYVHNVVGLTFTPIGVAIAYYFIPKIANVPLYGHKLSMIGFWTISFVYAWIGTHHIIHGPVSQWLQTVAIIFSIWLFIPVWTVIWNFFGTLKGHWNKYTQSAPLRFLMMGTVFYLITCIQGPVQALRNVNELTSKTDWIIGHSHLALYGTFTFFAIGGIYHAIPHIVRKPLWSDRLANYHFSLSLIGGLLYFISMSIGGVIQGIMWAEWANGDTYAQMHHNLSQVSFLQTIADMWWWWLARAIGGVLIFLGACCFLLNIFNTVVLEPRAQKTDIEAGT